MKQRQFKQAGSQYIREHLQGSFESSGSVIGAGFDPIVALERTKFYLQFKQYIPPLGQWEQWYKQGHFCLLPSLPFSVNILIVS